MLRKPFLNHSVVSFMALLSFNAFSQSLITDSVKVIAPDGTESDSFGRSVAMNDKYIYIGAARDLSINDAGPGLLSGSVYIYDKETGLLVTKRLSMQGSGLAFFGHDIAAAGKRAVIGSPNLSREGGASILEGTEEVELLAPFAPIGASTDLGLYGFSTALSDDTTTFVIGARSDTGHPDAGSNGGGGALYIYKGDDVKKVFASDADIADNLGYSVATTSRYAAVSAPFDRDKGEDSGSVYVFDTGSGRELFKLVPEATTAKDFFGFSVAAEGSIIAASSPTHITPGDQTATGAVYLFNADDGSLIHTLTVPGSFRFGWSLAIDNGRLAVSDPGGSAYVYDLESGELLNELVLSPRPPEVRFGTSIDINDNLVIVADEFDRTNGLDSGAAYVFDLSGGQFPDPSDQVHEISVQSMTVGSYDVNRNRKGASVNIVIGNQNGLRLEGVRVKVKLDGRIRETLTGVTRQDGSVLLRSRRTHRIRANRPLTYTACVTQVESDLPYAEADNVTTCESF